MDFKFQFFFPTCFQHMQHAMHYSAVCIPALWINYFLPNSMHSSPLLKTAIYKDCPHHAKPGSMATSNKSIVIIIAMRPSGDPTVSEHNCSEWAVLTS